MPSKQLDPQLAREHIRDSEDLLTECVKNIKRVVKSFPALEQVLSPATGEIESARSKLGDAKQQLGKA